MQTHFVLYSYVNVFRSWHHKRKDYVLILNACVPFRKNIVKHRHPCKSAKIYLYCLKDSETGTHAISNLQMKKEKITHA